MPAGLNRVCEVIRFSNEISGVSTDDEQGGAVPTGTVVYQNLGLRIKSEEPTLVLLEQGLATPTLFSAHLFSGLIVIEHNDQIRITAPTNDFLYNKKFRVIGIQRSSNTSSQDRNFIRITLKRWEESVSNAVQ